MQIKDILAWVPLRQTVGFSPTYWHDPYSLKMVYDCDMVSAPSGQQIWHWKIIFFNGGIYWDCQRCTYINLICAFFLSTAFICYLFIFFTVFYCLMCVKYSVCIIQNISMYVHIYIIPSLVLLKVGTPRGLASQPHSCKQQLVVQAKRCKQHSARQSSSQGFSSSWPPCLGRWWFLGRCRRKWTLNWEKSWNIRVWKETQE